MNWYLWYFIGINFLALVIFVSDKKKAKKNKQRTPESVLHFFELLGGVFFILPGMYLFCHKNRKWKYFLITYLIFVLWLAFIYLAKERFLN